MPTKNAIVKITKIMPPPTTLAPTPTTTSDTCRATVLAYLRRRIRSRTEYSRIR
ncbi:hypothetical protein [Actinomadura chokoriensis]|uniref:hypothetical protein n=1 Tax=Actinomadura chokoriensis TaxID=454156 RepID=UPI003566582F